MAPKLRKNQVKHLAFLKKIYIFAADLKPFSIGLVIADMAQLVEQRIRNA